MQNLFKILQFELENQPVTGRTGVIDQNCDVAQLALRFPEESGYLFLHTHVGLHHNGSPAKRGNGGLSLEGTGFIASVIYDDIGAHPG
jgi:hypothetical protein